MKRPIITILVTCDHYVCDFNLRFGGNDVTGGNDDKYNSLFGLDDLPVGQGCSEISLFEDFGMVNISRKCIKW